MKERDSSDDAPNLRRGDIWWIDLPPPEGSEPGDRHPFLILQRDTFNRSTIRTVVGLVITSNTGLANLPGNVLIPRGVAGLSGESVVNVTQVLTVDKRVHLAGYVGSLPREMMRKVESGLRLVLDL